MGAGPPPVRLTLYVILGSHAARSAMLMLAHKRLAHRLVTLPTGLHPLGLRLAGFAPNAGSFRSVDGAFPDTLVAADRMGTVPALRAGSERIKRNHEIARYLDRLRPDPPLLPADPGLRAEVEEAERFADEDFQMVARRLTLAGGQGPEGLIDRADRGRLGPLLWRRTIVRRIGSRAVARAFAVDPAAEQSMLAALPAMLDRIDNWIAAAVVSGEQLNVADCMIAPSLALLCYRHDLSREIAARPLGRLVDRLLPEP
jgi:glutathione S-transferase